MKMVERRTFVKGLAAAAVLPSALADAAEPKKGPKKDKRPAKVPEAS